MKIGLIGTGRIGRMHARNLAAHPRCELVAVQDVHGPSAQEAAAETGAQAVADVDQLLERVDAVMIASSTDTHCDLIARAAQAGKAVLCEKPIHLDIAEVDRCKAAIASASAPIQIGFNRRFDPGHTALAKAVQSGDIGQPEMLVITSRDPAPPPVEYLKVSGGLFRDMMIHDLDIARFIMQTDPVELSAFGTSMVDPAIGELGDVDTAMVAMRFPSGALVHINCSRRSVYGYDQRIEAFGSEGMLISGNHTETQLERYGAKQTAARERLLDFFIERYARSYVNEVDAFVDTVEGKREVSPAFEDGRQALVLADAALESLNSGKAVQLGA